MEEYTAEELQKGKLFRFNRRKNNRFGGYAKPKKRGEMNKTEASYAAHLDRLIETGQIIGYWYESVTLVLGNDCSIVPDFMVQQNDGKILFVDTKAYREESAKKWDRRKKRKKTLHAEPHTKIKAKWFVQRYPFQLFFAAYNKATGEWDHKTVLDQNQEGNKP